jgi:hypothetical protein
MCQTLQPDAGLPQARGAECQMSMRVTNQRKRQKTSGKLAAYAPLPPFESSMFNCPDHQKQVCWMYREECWNNKNLAANGSLQCVPVNRIKCLASPRFQTAVFPVKCSANCKRPSDDARRQHASITRLKQFLGETFCGGTFVK